MRDFVEFYRAYGESLAIRLRAIGHSEASSRFIFVEDLATAEEVIAASSSGLKPEMNVLVWERFTEQLRTGGRDNYNTRPQGSLAIIRKPIKDSREARSSAIDTCRSVALKVMGLMLQDEQDQESVLAQAGIRFELDGQSGESIPLLRGGWVGYGFSFDWLAPLDLDLSAEDLL